MLKNRANLRVVRNYFLIIHDIEAFFASGLLSQLEVGIKVRTHFSLIVNSSNNIMIIQLSFEISIVKFYV